MAILRKLYPLSGHGRDVFSSLLTGGRCTGENTLRTALCRMGYTNDEPTLLGVAFYRRVVELQKPFRGREEIRSSLQTNALRLHDAWCAFFEQNDFVIGVSLDGPGKIHDRYCKNRKGNGTFDRVTDGVRILQKRGV